MEKNHKIFPGGRIAGYMEVPGDKSISIRAVLLSAISDGESKISGIGSGDDINSALKCIGNLGIKYKKYSNNLKIFGKGLQGFSPAKNVIDCGNSGTTLRLLAGILAGQKHEFTLTGDYSLKARPMKRIVDPLRKMGSKIEYINKEGYAPIRIYPSKINPMNYLMPVASAQVKSCILLASLYANGTTEITEKSLTRDHTELMLKEKGVKVIKDALTIKIENTGDLLPLDINIPGDISSAAFFIILTSLLPDSELKIYNVGVNKTRTGIIDILKMMDGNINIVNQRRIAGEPVGDISIKYAELSCTEISGDLIPKVIDEIPIIAIAAALAKGKTKIVGAKELRIKETDRIAAVSKNLQRMGVSVKEFDDGMEIEGAKLLKGSILDSYSDHRIAMAFTIAAVLAKGTSTITHSEWADISFPNFYSILNRLREHKRKPVLSG